MKTQPASEEVALIEEVKKTVAKELPLTQLSNEQLLEEITEILDKKLRNRYLSISRRVAITEGIFSFFRGYGVLDQIICDDDVTEIMINGKDNIFIEKKGSIEKLDLQFEQLSTLENTIQKIVGAVGREVNQSSPIVDTRLEDGSRVNVVLPPIAINGPIVTIRKFSKKLMTIEHLISCGTLTKEAGAFLEKLVVAKYNIFISGGTGSGKTTFLNALSNFIPKDERIITIEDTAELQIAGVLNLVQLETRNANTAGYGLVSMQDLIKTSLRMRPERIIVGEVRGAEAIDMLQAMNTGHSGSMSTGHGNSSQDMISRLETMVLQGEGKFPLLAIRQQIASAIDIIVYLSRMRDKSRKVLEISEISGVVNGEVVLNPLYKFIESQESETQKVMGKLCRTTNKMLQTKKLKASGVIL